MSDYNYSLELEPKTLPHCSIEPCCDMVKDLAKWQKIDLSAVLALTRSTSMLSITEGLLLNGAGKNEEALEDFRAIHNKYLNFILFIMPWLR